MIKRITSIACNKPCLITQIIFFIFLLFYFSFLFTTQVINSTDLNFHILHIERYKSLWFETLFAFYNPSTFTGWPSVLFYGFFSYLVTVFLSYIFDPFTPESVRLATHIIIAFGLSSLILSLSYLLYPFFIKYLSNGSRDKNIKYWIFCSLSLCVLTFWFLNKRYYVGGIGASAIISTGLYAQLFGWHILILYLGVLFRTVFFEKKNLKNYLAILLLLSLITHILTATFLIFITVYYILIKRNYRNILLESLLTGILLSSFWFIPFLSYIGEYTVYNPDSSKDILIKIFEYPLYNMLISLKRLLYGDILSINYSKIIVFFVLISAFLNERIKKDELFTTLLLFVLLFIVLTAGVYPVSSLPIALHYYRYQGLLIILLIVLINLILLGWYKEALRIPNKAVSNFVLLLLFSAVSIIFISNLYVPSLSYKKDTPPLNNYDNQKRVYSEIIKDNKALRVYSEYLTDYERFPPDNSAHYLSLLLAKDTNNESITDIFIEPGKSNYYISSSFKYLGASTYPSNLLINKRYTDLDNNTLINQIKSFGISHVIAGNEAFYNNIRKHAIETTKAIGNYRIVKLQEPNHLEVPTIAKVPVGYIDHKGTLKFSKIDYYFYINKELTTNFELLELEDLKAVPSEIDIIIINHLPNNIEQFIKKYNLSTKKVIFINYFNDLLLINNDNVIFSSNPDKTEFQYVKYYLEKKINLKPRLIELVKEYNLDANTKSAYLEWESNYQAFALSRLIPNKIYRINYSYFPYWHTTDGKLYRGSAERMFFIPNSNQAILKFTKLYSLSTWIGWILTLSALIYIGFSFYKVRRQ